MDYAAAYVFIGGLSSPSKMPWYGFSTPAEKCITGSKLREVAGSTCGSCYALKGRYLFPNVQNAMKRRLDAVHLPQWEDAFVTVLTRLHQNTKATYKVAKKTVKEDRFRWHDSGDVQSVEHLRKISNIAKRTPFLKHWLPTREIAFVKEFLQTEKFSPNLTVRYSVPMVGAKMRTKPYGMDQSTVGRDTDKEIHQCPAAAKQGNKCLNCAACWTRGVDVNYPLH